MSIKKLKNELTTDPLNIGYSSMTSAEIFAYLTDVSLQDILKGNVTGDDVFKATKLSEYSALSDFAKLHWLTFCNRQSIDLQSAKNKGLVKEVFGEVSATFTAFKSYSKRKGSRAETLGIYNLRIGHIEYLRSK